MNEDTSVPPTSPTDLVSRTLTPLSSGYQEVEHGTYARYLTAGLQQPKVFNIALTGGYGSGKSSVIEYIENSKELTVLNVAISSLGNDLGEPGSAAKGASKGADLTNRIEKAIVKQLLYRESPKKLPASDFHRHSKFPVVRATLTSAAGVAGAVAIPVLLGWNLDFLGQGAEEWLTGAGALGIATAGLTTVRAFLHQRFSVSQLSAVGASVTLAQRPTSYFDKYLAEIVYFFEVTDYDVVVFEDLDRFENPGIFEALRELNTILNESNQVGRKVRFVYAVRDSVFEKLGQEPTSTAPGPDGGEEESSSGTDGASTTNLQGDVDAAQAEVERANRTKFFDLVIPLVPFITHRSAHELLAKLFPEGEAHRPSDELIDRVARHVPDMRMLKNIRNEYCVFSEQLLVQGKGAPDLSPDTLLSLVLYKHFHLADFEKIIHGRSDLDTLYKAYRATVNDSIRDTDERLRALDSADSDASVAQAQADELGARFTELVDIACHGQKMLSITVGTTEFGTQVTDWLKFWRQAAADGSITVTVSRQVYNVPPPFKIETATLERVLNHPLTGDGFKNRATRSVEERRKHQDNRNFLRGASMAALNSRTEFTAHDTGLPLAHVIGALKSELTRELIREGYSDHNFTLYVAQFYGNRLSKNVQTFIVRNVDTNTSDANYQLSPDEVVSLLAEAGPRCLRGASAYNVSVLDHLLGHRDPQATLVLDRLAAFGKDEQLFVETYLSNGEHRDRLSAGLSSRWPHTLVYLAHEAQLDASRRVAYVDAALSALNPDISYDAEDALGEFLATNYAGMTSYTGELQQAQVDTIVATTEKSGARIADLSALHPTMLRAVVEADLYPLTTTNLRAAMESAPTIALDRVRGDSEALYADCLEQPEAFLAAVADDDETEFTIDEPQHFAGILDDVAGRWNAEHIEALIAGSSPACRFTRLAEAPTETWVPMAAHHRFPATIANIQDYRAEQGIDDALGNLLTAAEAIELHDKVAQSELHSLATALLNSRTAIADPAHRVRLTQSLDLAEPLEPSDVPAEAGRLLSLLLAERLVADTEEIFARFAGTDWATIESAMSASAAFRRPSVARDSS
ncbi:YobI family P-loop NTPase [Auraticoccus monumenti]|uniref:YobI-like P-loop NTPase domain-containing protein n=1 Tax=Auraticoccus monumenti TaxID=675864 RepID=A0A1G7AHD5_9ACTN|nr:hypothetical protein [Auraticoccus monumenti]SDE14241.1 hypothetical protein SAMN04489747_2618 [Auraticoccus monumenti]